MIKPLTTIAAAGALAAATVAVPTQANALAQWIVPAIVVAGVGGLAVGAVATANAGSYAYSPAYAPRAPYMFSPARAASCQIVRERAPNGTIRRVQSLRVTPSDVRARSQETPRRSFPRGDFPCITSTAASARHRFLHRRYELLEREGLGQEGELSVLG